jgi:hypothetical protein
VLILPEALIGIGWLKAFGGCKAIETHMSEQITSAQ